MDTTQAPDVIPSDLVDVTAAAKAARCSIATLYRWQQTGRLRYWKRVGRRFVSLAELLGLFRPVAGGSQAPAPQAVNAAAHERWVSETLRRAGWG